MRQYMGWGWRMIRIWQGGGNYVCQGLGWSQGSRREPNSLGKKGLGESDLPSKALQKERSLHRSLPYSAPQCYQNWLLLPLEPVQARGLWWELSLLGYGQVRGQWGDILFRWACLFLNLFARISFSHAGGQERKAFLCRPFPPAQYGASILRPTFSSRWGRWLLGEGTSQPMCLPLLLGLESPNHIPSLLPNSQK